MKYITILLVISACNSSSTSDNTKLNDTTASISQLLNDTFVDKKEKQIVNSDSLEKAVLKQLNYMQFKSIELLDPENLTLAYENLLNFLNKQNDSTKSEQNLILLKVFEKLNAQQTKLDETAEMDIKVKLKLARLKSEIWPYFKK